MKNIKRNLLISVLALGVATSVTSCSKEVEAKEVVKLESQKEVIDESLLVKSLDNFKDFKAEAWLKDGRIIGIKNQPINDEKDKISKISIYDPNTKLFEDVVHGKEKEWLFVGDLSEDENELLYTALVDGNFKDNVYDIYSINLKTKESKKIISKAASVSETREGYVYISQGLKLFRYGFGKELEEIILPKDLVLELNDFSNFEFEDYLNRYYKGEIVEGKRRDLIKSNYQHSRENNSLRLLTNLGDEVLLNSQNGKTYIYNIKDNSYKLDTDVKKNVYYNALDDKNDIYEREFLENGKVILWKLDKDGKREFKIEELSGYMRYKLSPDKSKLMYNYEDSNGKTNSYIYNFKTEEKTIIYPEVAGNISWKDDSKSLFITGRKVLNNGDLQEITSLMQLN